MLPSFNINVGYVHTDIDESLVEFFMCTLIVAYSSSRSSYFCAYHFLLSLFCSTSYLLKIEQVLGYSSPITHLFSLFI